jgi:hypothetical protein
MPYYLRHRETGEVAAGILRNVYDLDYYGAVWFETEEAAAAEVASAPVWAPTHVTEAKLKVFNVKLNNDAGRKLFVDDDGTLRVEKSSAE